MTTYLIDGVTYTATEIMDDPALAQRAGAVLHAEMYPAGCNTEGHRCSECSSRLGETGHRRIKIGVRSGYKGTWVCGEPTCPDYRRA